MNPTDLRLAVHANGFRPVPVSSPDMGGPSAGKRPTMKDWARACAEADADAIRRWERDQPRCTNTGLLCGDLVAIDIDVPVPELAGQVEALASAMVGPSPLRRVGRAPKVLFCYRAEAPMRKASTPELFMPDGTKCQVEILGEGQQFVAFGIHPDTRAPYTWSHASPEAVALSALPVVAEGGIRAFLAAAEAVIRAAGAMPAREREAASRPPAAKPLAVAQPAPVARRQGERPPASTRAPAGKAGAFFVEVNKRALAELGRWVPTIFGPAAREEAGTGAWRVASRDLGRGLEEDLSLHPLRGGHDFGTGESCSPIDVVIAWGGAPGAREAGLWLCDQMGIDPASLGWKPLPWAAERPPAPASEARGGPAPPKPSIGASTPPPSRGQAAPAEPPEDWPDLVTEDAVAELFMRRHGKVLRYCHDSGAWFRWDGAIWRREKTKIAFAWARVAAREAAARTDNDKAILSAGRAAFASGVERHAMADPQVAALADTWDPDPWLLGTPGGTVDLRTGELRAARQADHITKAVAVAPAEDSACPAWLAFLHQATGGDADLITFLQRWFGYGLTGDTREHALLFVYGPGGNGKGVLLNTMAGIMGSYGTTAALDTFTAAYGDKHSTDLAMLHGARLVMTTETEEGKAWAEARIKALTGGDPITARFMRQDNFTFLPRFKLTISGNHKPALKNVDDAARRRFNIVPFLHKPDRPDPTLPARLRAEWSGILRWMIDGCLEWQQFGLGKPAAVQAATEEYFQAQDAFGAWVAERCILDPNLAERPGLLLSDFNAWALKNGEQPASRHRFRGWAEKQERFRFKDVRGSLYLQGLGLRTTEGAQGAHGCA